MIFLLLKIDELQKNYGENTTNNFNDSFFVH